LDIDPGNTGALFQIANIHRAQNAPTDLVDTLHRVIEVGAATLDDAQIEDVYMQLGGLYRGELEQPVDAVDSYEKALEVNPANMAAIDAIQEIHTVDEMWEDVIGAMEKRVIAFDSPDQKIQQLIEIAQHWDEKVGNPDGGTSAYQRILGLDARHELAFTKLEELHGEANRSEELIDMYITRFEDAESVDEQRGLLMKAAKVSEVRMESLGDAYDTLEAAWSLDYTHKPTWLELERVTRAIGTNEQWSHLLTVAQQAIQEAQDPQVKIALCLQCARWYGQELGHQEYALPFYQQVKALDPANVDVTVSMADLYESTGQYDAYAQALGQIISVSTDKEIIADTYTRMGDLSKGHLNQPNEAPNYYRKALDAYPQHLKALEALEKVYAADGNDEKLIEILQQKATVLEDPADSIAAKLQLAEAYETRVGDAERAIETYVQVREAENANMPALKGLERLYAMTERWQELLEVLQAQLELVTSERERVEILMQLASMWEEQFLKPDTAAERLEQVVEIDPTHSDALNGLARLYRAQLRWDDVIETYERHVSATPDRAEKIRIYKSLGETYAADLDDADRAVDAYLNVLSIEEDDIEALDALTRIYDKRGDHVSALEMMEQLARLVQDPAHQVDLLYRAGRILDEELGDRASALDKYQMAIDLDPGHLESLAAMRAINLDAGDYLAAAKLLEQEAQYQQSPRVIAERLVMLGQVYEERLDEHEKAVATFEQALQQDGDNEDAALPLVDEYTKQERHADALPLLEMLVKRSGKREPEEQHRLAFALGEASMKLERTEDAIKAFEKAYQVDSTHLPTLLGVAGAHYAAAQWDKAFKFYQMLLVHHRDALAPDEIVDIFYRLGIVKREQKERRKALNMFDKALEEDPHHQPTLEAVIGLYEAQKEWQQVIHFTKQILETTDDYDARFKLLERVGDLWNDKLSNAAKAIEAYQEASDLRPEDHKMLHKLLMAYQGTRQWEQAVEIIEQISALDDRDTVKSKYAYTVGVILRDELKDADRALEKFNKALDLDTSQLKAFEAINKILNVKKDWKALERAYRKMIHRVIQQPEQNELKFNLFHQLGIIYRDRQRNFEAAAEAFKTSTQFAPEGAQAQQHQILAELFTAMPERVADAIEEHQWLLRQDPYRVDSYRALYKLYFDQRAYDKAWCLASTLTFLNKADNEQQQFYTQYKPQGPIKPRGRVDRAMWFNDVFHPGEDR
ncbi:MAG: tetratricopeptide repeat protein, partial [Planctomycetota bacterium]